LKKLPVLVAFGLFRTDLDLADLADLDITVEE